MASAAHLLLNWQRHCIAKLFLFTHPTAHFEMELIRKDSPPVTRGVPTRSWCIIAIVQAAEEVFHFFFRRNALSMQCNAMAVTDGISPAVKSKVQPATTFLAFIGMENFYVAVAVAEEMMLLQKDLVCW